MPVAGGMMTNCKVLTNLRSTRWHNRHWYHLIVFTKRQIAPETVSMMTRSVQLRFGVTAEMEPSHASRPSEIRPSQLPIPSTGAYWTAGVTVAYTFARASEVQSARLAVYQRRT
jgi:hypothetical protein